MENRRLRKQNGNNNTIIRFDNKMLISGKAIYGYKVITEIYIYFPGTCLKSINIMNQIMNL